MLQEMRLRNVYEHFMRPIVLLAASLTLALAWSACTPGDGGMNDGIISGVVEGRNGPEAGVWVIAETDALGTGFVKIVVTDDDCWAVGRDRATRLLFHLHRRKSENEGGALI